MERKTNEIIGLVEACLGPVKECERSFDWDKLRSGLTQILGEEYSLDEDLEGM